MPVRAFCLFLIAALLAACQVGTAGEPPMAVTPRASTPTIDETPVATTTPPPTEFPIPSVRPTLTPIPTPSPSPSPSATPSVPPPSAFAFNLFEEGDFVPQYTFEWCVAASIQMAHNLVAADNRTTPDDQAALWEQARSFSSDSFRGANPLGWAAVLDEIGIGPYEVVSVADYDEALRTAAAAMRATERPVGLVMWRGRHAWVMNGFESMGDPAVHADFSVAGVRVLDPLFPHGSGVWGPSPEPNSLLSPAELATQFVVREPRRWSSDLRVGYLLVLPTSDESVSRGLPASRHLKAALARAH